MKAMKKWIAAALLACLILCGCSAVADTEVTVDSEEKTATTSVVLDLGEQPTSYIVVIPSTVSLNPETGKGSATVTLKSGFVLTDVTSLKVCMTDGYTEGYFVEGKYGGSSTTHDSYMTLTNASNESTIKCIIKYDNTYVTKTTTLISVTNQTSNASDKTATLSFNTEGTLPSYGKYVGTLTFTITTA